MQISNYIKTNANFNLSLFVALSNVSDCPAADLMYHLACYTQFQRIVNKSIEEVKEGKKVDYALHYVIDELITAASRGDVILLDEVWVRYQDYANKYNSISIGS